MNLKVYGEISAYYVQTLCLIFFPGEHFPVSDAENEELTCTVSVEMRPEGAFSQRRARKLLHNRNGALPSPTAERLPGIRRQAQKDRCR